jgi:hypothetical protein
MSSQPDKAFPLEKILTVRAETYVASKGKELKDFDMVGVHDDMVEHKHTTTFYAFQKAVPKEAEVVTDLQKEYDGGMGEIKYSGTALIPKKSNR